MKRVRRRESAKEPAVWLTISHHDTAIREEAERAVFGRRRCHVRQLGEIGKQQEKSEGQTH